MNLVSCDDSKGGDCAVMGALVLGEDMIHAAEKYLAAIKERLVPMSLRENFEFHASALFNAKPPFENIGRDAALAIFKAAAQIVTNPRLTPIFYGAVNLRALNNPSFASTEPL